MILAAVKSV